MSAGDGAQRTVAEIDFDHATSSSTKIGDRSVHQFWNLFSTQFRGVLLPPQRRPEGGKISWVWQEPAGNQPFTGPELVEVRRRLSVGKRLLTGGLVDDDLDDSGRARGVDSQVRASVNTMVDHLLSLSDKELAGYACRTEMGLMLHSWGAAKPTQPSGPNTQKQDVEGTVFVDGVPTPNVTVMLETTARQRIGRTQSDESGSFLFQAIAPGEYRLRVADRSDFSVQGLTITIGREALTGLELRGGNDLQAVAATTDGADAKRRRWLIYSFGILLLLAAIGFAVWYARQPSPVAKARTLGTGNWESARGSAVRPIAEAPLKRGVIGDLGSGTHPALKSEPEKTTNQAKNNQREKANKGSGNSLKSRADDGHQSVSNDSELNEEPLIKESARLADPIAVAQPKTSGPIPIEPIAKKVGQESEGDAPIAARTDAELPAEKPAVNKVKELTEKELSTKAKRILPTDETTRPMTLPDSAPEGLSKPLGGETEGMAIVAGNSPSVVPDESRTSAADSAADIQELSKSSEAHDQPASRVVAPGSERAGETPRDSRTKENSAARDAGKKMPMPGSGESSVITGQPTSGAGAIASQPSGAKKHSPVGSASAPPDTTDRNDLDDHLKNEEGNVGNGESGQSPLLVSDDHGASGEFLRVETTVWRTHLFEDVILPTQPMLVRAGTVNLADLRAKLLREQNARMPVSFQAPVTASGIVLLVPESVGRMRISWQDETGREPSGALVEGNRAEIGWSGSRIAAGKFYRLVSADGREIGRVSADQSGVLALTKIAGVRCSYWMGVERAPTEKNKRLFAWRLMSGAEIPAAWVQNEAWRQGNGQRLEIPLDDQRPVEVSYPLALTDAESGWALVCRVLLR